MQLKIVIWGYIILKRLRLDIHYLTLEIIAQAKGAFRMSSFLTYVKFSVGSDKTFAGAHRCNLR